MPKQSKLSKKQQALAAEWMPLARMLARFFVQQRAPWQRSVYVDDLEADGYLAIVKAARTYDKARLPYPRAYFARACLNAMCRSIRKLTRQPGEWKISLAEADQMVHFAEDPDWLRMAISDMGEDAELCEDRFVNGLTLRQLAERHQLSLRSASVRARRLAQRLAAQLGIQLSPRKPDSGSPRCRNTHSRAHKRAFSHPHAPTGRR
jgi:DNA-directed RNA polymerase specialized sigma24 family protein